jgi:hypothetical protein
MPVSLEPMVVSSHGSISLIESFNEDLVRSQLKIILEPVFVTDDVSYNGTCIVFYLVFPIQSLRRFQWQPFLLLLLIC